MTCGIYKLSFKGTNKVYIGLSVNIERRYRSHVHCLRNSTSNSKLQEAYRDFGVPLLEVLCECEIKELEKYEKEAIEIFDSIDNGLNIRDGGATGSTNNCGSVNHKALHSNETYIKVFNLLIENILSYKEIAVLTCTSIQIVDHIASGVSHKWLESAFPEKYLALRDLLNTRNLKRLNLINPTGIAQGFDSLIEFSELTGIPKSSISGLVTGATKNLKGWKLANPVIYTPKKHRKYLVLNKGQCVEFTNISKFCRENNISNRKSFSKFLLGDKGSNYLNYDIILN